MCIKPVLTGERINCMLTPKLSARLRFSCGLLGELYLTWLTWQNIVAIPNCYRSKHWRYEVKLLVHSPRLIQTRSNVAEATSRLSVAEVDQKVAPSHRSRKNLRSRAPPCDARWSPKCEIPASNASAIRARDFRPPDQQHISARVLLEIPNSSANLT